MVMIIQLSYKQINLFSTILLSARLFVNTEQELLKLMGMRMWLYWSSWFVKYLLFMLISAIAMTIVFHAQISSNGPVIVHISATITFVFLLLYSLALVTFCFLISTLFSKGEHFMHTCTCSLKYTY